MAKSSVAYKARFTCPFSGYRMISEYPVWTRTEEAQDHSN